jgi:hypothetical protein
MTKSFDHCNKCGKEDDRALIHCAVCSYPYHPKCVASKLTIKACDDLIANDNFQFYCDDHKNLCVHKLLNRISLLERKFRVCLEPLESITNELDKHQTDLAESRYEIATVLPQSEVNSTASSLLEHPDSIAPETPIHQSFSNVTIRRSQKNRQNGSIANTNSSTENISTPDRSFSNTAMDNDKQKTTSKTLHSSDASTRLNLPSTSASTNQVLASPSTEPSLEETCGITVVPPPKAIFLSRLGADVSKEQVEKFIKTKIPNAVGLSVRKMLFKSPREYSTFVVNTGNNAEVFNTVVDSSFWPALTVVKEFQHFLRPPRAFSNLQ